MLYGLRETTEIDGHWEDGLSASPMGMGWLQPSPSPPCHARTKNQWDRVLDFAKTIWQFEFLWRISWSLKFGHTLYFIIVIITAAIVVVVVEYFLCGPNKICLQPKFSYPCANCSEVRACLMRPHAFPSLHLNRNRWFETMWMGEHTHSSVTGKSLKTNVLNHRSEALSL